jgi:hypothetical protein
MKSIVGVFESLSSARDAAELLFGAGIHPKYVTVLAPGSPEAVWDRVPTSGTEQPGMGEAVGGMVGGAVGVATGAPLGAALASLLLPGVGPIVAVGIAAAAILGAGGVAAGVAAGKRLEDHLFTGLPEDEIFFYEDALRRGRAVLIAFTEDDKQQETVHRLLQESGAESLDAARESWWLGLRSAEQQHYQPAGADFQGDERSYRHGFEAALRPSMRGKPYEQVLELLREHYPDAADTLFRRGYERGQAYFNNLANRP